MTVNEYSEEFYGRRVVEFFTGDEATQKDVVYRLTQENEDEQSQRELLEEFLRTMGPQHLEALILGPWSEAATGTPPNGYLDALVELRLPNLKALFVGDMTSEDSEISWINQVNYARLIEAYPRLEVLRIRGSTELSLPATEYPALRELAIECGGLPNYVVESIRDSKLPALRKLELWLGSEGYGFDGDLATYEELLAKIDPRRLEYLGLRDSEIADQLAVFLAKQEWLGSLHTLDLSMGTLSDEGAQALLASPYLKGLKVLNLTYHYISPALVKKLKALPLTVHIGEAQEGDGDDRYVQVGE